MSHQFFPFILLLLVTSAWGIVLYDSNEQTEEGKLMTQVCKMIKSRNSEKALDKIEILIELVVSNPDHPMEGNYWIAHSQLQQLRREIMDGNKRLYFYYWRFAHILNRLAYGELKSVVDHLDSGNDAEVNRRIRLARHFIHDATLFSKDQFYTDERQLIRASSD